MTDCTHAICAGSQRSRIGGLGPCQWLDGRRGPARGAARGV